MSVFQLDDSALEAALQKLLVPWLAALVDRVVYIAAAIAPRRTGRLSISHRGDVTGQGPSLTGIVTAATFYAGYVARGTAPHVITARNAKVLRFIGSNGSVVFRRSVNHPGTAANPWLLTALQQVIGELA